MKEKKAVKKSRNRNVLSAIIKIVVSALIIVYLFKIVDFKLLISHIQEIRLGFFVLSVALLYPSMLIRAIRFRIIINKSGFSISTTDAYKLTLIGSALNIFLPASTGDIAKAYYGYKKHKIREEMLSASLIDKLIALLSLFIIGSISSLFFRFISFFVISIVCMLFLLIIIFFPRIVPWRFVNRVMLKLTKKGLNYKKLVGAFTLDNNMKVQTIILSISGWLLTYSQLFLICYAYSVPVRYLYLLAIAPLMMLARMFPLTLNGIGATEAMVAYLFSLAGIGVTSSLIISLTNTLVVLIIPGIVGLFFILREK